MTRPLGPLLAAVALCIGAASTVAGCGVPLDDSPRAIDQSTTSTTSPTTVAPAQPGGRTQSVFYLDDDELVDAPIPVVDSPSIEAALTAVLSAPRPPLVTRIPDGTELLGLDLDGRTAVINLSEEINDIEAERQTQAYAQLVFTSLASGQADQVTFLVEGKQVQAPTDNGGLRVVSADDYEPPLNPR